jgi:hypothetical protein
MTITNLHQIGTIVDFIEDFEILAIHTKYMFGSFLKECFINGLKEEIQAQAMMKHPTNWLVGRLRLG